MSESNPPQTIKSFWPDYLASGYFDAAGHLDRQYVQSHRVTLLVDNLRIAGLTFTQLRRYFQHCRSLETRLKSGRASWPEVAPQFDLLESAANNAMHKLEGGIPWLFYDFLVRNVVTVQQAQDQRRAYLDGFVMHYAALVGFCAGRLHKN